MKRTVAIFLAASLTVGAMAQEQQKAPPPKVVEVPVPVRPQLTPTASKGTLTPELAVRLAIQNQPTLEEVQQAVIAAKGRTQQVRSVLYPQLTVGGKYDTSRFTGNDPNRAQPDVINGFGASASVRQLIFDAGHSKDLVSQSKALEEVAAKDLARARADLALQTLTAFYLVAQADRLVAVNERNVLNRKNQLALAQSRFSEGIGLASDVVTAQTANGEAVQSLIQARANADTARVSLAQTIGFDPQTPIVIENTGAPEVALDSDVSKHVSEALSKRPEVLRVKAALLAAKYGAKAAKTTNAPSLSLSLNAANHDPGFPAGGGSVNAGLVLSFPIIDGGLRSGRVQEAEALRKSSEADVRVTELAVRSEVSRVYLQLRGAEERLSAARSNVSNAQESVRISEGRYTSGLGTFLDIINSQASLLTAETAVTNAEADVATLRVAFERATGNLPVK